MPPGRRAPARLAGLAAGLLLALAPAGCGRSAYPVEGKVVFDDDKPAVELAGGTVSVESKADQSNAAGDIQPDGTFRLKTPQGRDGAPPGTYRVVVLPPPPDDPDRRPPPVIDRRYGRYETSGLEITVKPQTNQVVIKVQRLRRGKAT